MRVGLEAAIGSPGESERNNMSSASQLVNRHMLCSDNLSIEGTGLSLPLTSLQRPSHL